MPQEAFSPDILAERLEALFGNPQTLNNTAAASLNAGQPDATLHLANAVEELIEV